jgi:hypothetical protein
MMQKVKIISGMPSAKDINPLKNISTSKKPHLGRKRQGAKLVA